MRRKVQAALVKQVLLVPVGTHSPMLIRVSLVVQATALQIAVLPIPPIHVAEDITALTHH